MATPRMHAAVAKARREVKTSSSAVGIGEHADTPKDGKHADTPKDGGARPPCASGDACVSVGGCRSGEPSTKKPRLQQQESPAPAGLVSGRLQHYVPAAATDEQAVAKAAAFRTKYQVANSPHRIAPQLVGVHPLNRDGIGVNGARCDELASKFAELGFDRAEADHDGVVVQEKPDCDEIWAFNHRICEGDDLLANVTEERIAFGTLAHSHVNQVLRNVIGGAASTSKKLTSEDGRLCLAMVERASPPFAQACREGLQWEILSWRMLEEEPRAACTIQAASNIKGGLMMVEHEMQALARLSRVCSEEMRVSHQVSCRGAQERMRRSMPQFADGPEFKHLLAFVLDLGAEEAGFIDDLKTFHSSFVNPNQRRVRADVFATVSSLPLDVPHLKVAMVKTAYTCPKSGSHIQHGYIQYVGSKDVSTVLQQTKQALASTPCASGENLKRGTADETEAILRYFHVACKDAVSSLGASKACEFLMRVDAGVTRVLLGKEALIKQLVDCGHVNEAAAVFLGELQGNIGGSHELPAAPFPVARKEIPAPAGMASLSDLAPKVIRFSDGLAQEQQTSMARAGNMERDLREWTQGAATHCADDLSKAQIFENVWKVGRFAPVYSEKDLRVSSVASKTSVFASRAFAQGELFLVPLVQSPAFIQANPVHPHSVDTDVEGARGVLAITPCVRIPKDDPKQKTTTFLPLFWALRRVEVPSSANCSVAQVSCTSVLTVGLGAKPLNPKQKQDFMTTEMQIPVATNTVAVAAGAELLLDAVKLKPKPAKQQKLQTWLDVQK